MLYREFSRQLRMKIKASSKKPFNLGSELFLNAIPAAHPLITYDKNKEPNALGWLLQYKTKKMQAESH